MLYFGNRCSRDCYFCCVEGSPEGEFIPFEPEGVEQILEILAPHGRIKLYGGEPTLHHRHCIELVRRLRLQGYVGRLTIFSNGIQADRLIQMLEADPPTEGHPGSDTYLNHFIWHGIGVPSIPESRRQQILAWAEAHPGRVWLSHEDVVPVGAAEKPENQLPLLGRTPDFGGRCARCFPTLRSDGRIHACAFAAEVQAPQYDLGRMGDSAQAVSDRYRSFMTWVDEVLEPEAANRSESPCVTCLRWARSGNGPLPEGFSSPRAAG